MDKVLVKDSTSVRYNAWARFRIHHRCAKVDWSSSASITGVDTKSLILLPGNSPKSKDRSDPEVIPWERASGAYFHGLEKLVWAQSRIRSKRLVQGNIREGRYPVLMQES